MPPKRASGKALSKESEDRNTAILDAAQYLFGRKGYQQTTMEEVAKQANLSVGTLYNIFGDKECLYGNVALRIGHAVLHRLKPLAEYQDPEQAVQDLNRLLLYNYVDDRLFFGPFCFPAHLQIQPEPERLDKELRALFEEYVDLVEGIFGRCRVDSSRNERPSVKMATYVEGIITAFMGHWSGPLQSDRLASAAKQITNMLLRSLDVTQGIPDESEDRANAETRASYITRFDLERLKELIEVVRTFGRDEALPHGEALETVLQNARITNPREVPPDVVTMNSRVRIRNLNQDTEQVLTLVFPKDAELSPDNVSILNPVGVAMFGRRVGDSFSVVQDQTELRYRVLQIPYQPEAAGDYHL